MTKMKSKKMTKSTFAIIIMAIVMVAMLAFGGTYAYFTATASGVTSGNLKTGKVILTGEEQVTITAGSYVPGQYILGDGEGDAAVAFTNSSDVATWTFVVVEIELAEDNELPADADDLSDLLVVTGQDMDGLTVYAADTEKATRIMYAGETAANANASYTACTTIQVNPAIESDTLDGALGAYQGIEFTVRIYGRAIQKEGRSLEQAYTSLFGNNG